MMLHFRQHDKITCCYILIAPAISDQVNTLGGIAREYNLFALANVDEASDFHTRLFHSCRCLFADLIDSTLDIGMRGLVIGTHSLDDGTGLLRTCCTVKINQRLTVYLARQDRKVLADIRRRPRRGGGAYVAPFRCHPYF